MKKFILLLLILICLVGCGNENVRNDSNNSIIPENESSNQAENSQQIINQIAKDVNNYIDQINDKLRNAQSIQIFKLDSTVKNEIDKEIEYIYKTEDDTKLEINFDNNGKLHRVDLYAPNYHSNARITRDYMNLKSILLYILIPTLTDKDMSEATPCFTGLETRFCVVNNIIIRSSDEISYDASITYIID